MKKHLLFLLCSLLAAFSIHAQQSVGYQDHWWRPNGPVNAIVRSGNTVYLGGQFDYIGPNLPYGTAISTNTGVASAGYAYPNGQVNACVPDGTGGWYIGGNFTQVGGQSRNYLARINPNGSLHPWNPNPDNGVSDLVLSGGLVYVGGSFQSIGGQSRNFVAALDTITGAANAWNPNANNVVEDIAVSGNTVYVSGFFQTIGGQNRNYIAALDAATGNATSWNPSPNYSVRDLVVSGNTVYVGGSFTSIGGQPRNYIAALHTTTGNATAWNPNANSVVYTLALRGNTVYAGGAFNTIGGQSRSRIAALDAATSNATAWNPNANDVVLTISPQSGAVYVGGPYTYIGGQPRRYLTALDTVTGAPTAWSPNAEGIVRTIAVSGTNLYAGGSFYSINGLYRTNLTAINASTGSPTAWNLNADSYINALAVSGSTVYVGGNFTSICGQSRNRIAALDTTTGNATSWNPNADNGVYALAVSGSTVYAAGDFFSIGGQSRRRIAALDATTGNATAWYPNTNDFILTLTLNGSTVYAGGYFTSIGGQSRNYIAALDATTGNATAWNPNANYPVSALAVSGNTVYAGGAFTTIGGQNRSRIATLDVTTGNATAWNPNANGNVLALAVSGNTVYAGGNFTSIGGQSRSRIAALDASTGNATAWNPNANSSVNTLAVSGNTVYAGGSFLSMAGNSTRRNFAALYDSTRMSTPPAASVTIAASANPACSGASVIFNATPANAGSPTYQWTRNGTAISGATATTYTSNTLANGDTIRCLMNSGGATVSSNAVRMTVNPLPNVTVTAGGPTSFCTGGAVTLSAPTGAAAYQWRKDSTIISGATNAAYTATISGNYTVTATSAVGCTGTSAATVVTAQSCAPTITTLSAGTALCREQSFSVSFSTPGTFNAGNTFSVQLSNSSGSFSTLTTIGTLAATGAASIAVTIPAAQATGTKYRIRIVSSSPATTSADNGANITISGLPSAAQVLISPTTTPKICEGDSVTLSVPATAGYSYQWLEDNVLISGATSNTYTAAPAATKVYSCIVTNASGCARTSVNRQVAVNGLPTAVISPAATQNICGPNASVSFAVNTGTGRTYQWYKNGTPISGATTSTYTATTPGLYTVQSSTSSGCSALSASVEVTANCSVDITNTGTQTLCEGSAVTAQFPASGFGTGNIFTLELSDANGSFAQPISIATLSATSSSAISGNIPTGTPAGNGYKLRINTSNPATIGQPSPLTLQVRNALTSAAPLCHVTVDSVTNKNKLTWSKPADPNVDSFVFYRQNDVATYVRVGAQAYSALSEWTDASSLPLTKAYRYAITAKNTCEESPLSVAHKTVHLTINKGVNNSTWNLIWNDYEGAAHSYYNIYRGATAGSMSLIGTAIADAYNSFTDNNAPASCVYMLEVADGPSCYAMRGTGSANTNSGIFSNMAVGGEKGFAPNWADMSVYPNPSNTTGTLQIESSNSSDVFSVRVMDVIGRVLQTTQATAGQKVSFGEALVPGLYTVEAVGEAGKRIVKKWTKQ